MAAVIVRTRALRWVCDDFPGCIEVGLVDADGRDHRIIEKVPVLTTADITSASTFPTELWLDGDAGEVEVGRVRVTFSHSVETVDELTAVDLSVDDVVWQ